MSERIESERKRVRIENERQPITTNSYCAFHTFFPLLLLQNKYFMIYFLQNQKSNCNLPKSRVNRIESIQTCTKPNLTKQCDSILLGDLVFLIHCISNYDLLSDFSQKSQLIKNFHDNGCWFQFARNTCSNSYFFRVLTYRCPFPLKNHKANNSKFARSALCPRILI